MRLQVSYSRYSTGRVWIAKTINNHMCSDRKEGIDKDADTLDNNSVHDDDGDD